MAKKFKMKIRRENPLKFDSKCRGEMSKKLSEKKAWYWAPSTTLVGVKHSVWFINYFVPTRIFMSRKKSSFFWIKKWWILCKMFCFGLVLCVFNFYPAKLPTEKKIGSTKKIRQSDWMLQKSISWSKYFQWSIMVVERGFSILIVTSCQHFSKIDFLSKLRGEIDYKAKTQLCPPAKK